MAISRLQNAVFASNAVSPYTVTATFGSNVTPGSTILVAIRHSGGSTTFTVTDNHNSGNYGKDIDGLFVTSTRYFAIYSFGKNTWNGSLTVSVAGGTATTRIWIVEVNVDLTNGAVLDKAVKSENQTGTTQGTSPSATPTVANEYLFGAIVTDHQATGLVGSVDAPWTGIGASANWMDIEEQVVSSVAAHNASWTLTDGTIETWGCAMTTYKAAGGTVTGVATKVHHYKQVGAM